MRQVFLRQPWVFKTDPEQLVRIFTEYGEPRKLAKGYVFHHGGEQGEVAYIQKGLAFFRFTDRFSKNRIFAVVPPGGCVGDLDVLTEQRVNVVAECARPTVALFVSGERFRKKLSNDMGLMTTYARRAIIKQEVIEEGMIANFTMPLALRLVGLLNSFVTAYYPLKPNDWNPIPVTLTTFEIANIIASTRSTISTILNEWMDKDLVRRDGRRLLCHGRLFTVDYDWDGKGVPG
ncbi:MAG TPA: Crp/Fnr family transcriptional regulator [Sutterella sp.]|nr:Crp/Fnr family transcriptional regulator [Sutterella sp.]